MIWSKGSTVDAATRADATHQANVKSWWRDWHRYLQAQLQLLDARQAEATHAPSFEQSETAWEQRRAEGEQTLKRIPHDRRVVFDRTREARRAEVQAELDARPRTNGAAQGGLDPEVVERETLTRLLADAEGAENAGEGWVPTADGPYYLQVAALLHAPAAADYTVVLDAGDDRRQRLALVGGLLLFMVIAVWWTWPRGAANAAVAPPPTELRINGHAAPLWQVVGLTVLDASGGRTALPTTATDAPLQWPTLPDGARGAWWRSTALSPVQMCLPPALLAGASKLEAQSSGDTPLRTYTLQTAKPTRPDLVLSPCAADATLAPRYGLLEAVTPRPDQPLDAPVQVGPNGPELRVTGFTVLGAGQDAALPPDKYRVVVHVAPATSVTWTTLDPRLVLQSGLEALPSAPIRVDQGQRVVDIPYLVPAWQRPIDVAWYVTDAATQAKLRWRATLDAPVSRAEALRDALEIQLAGQRGAEPNSAVLTLRLRNIGKTAMVIKNDDVVVRQGDHALPVTALGTAGVALTPGEARTLTLPLRGLAGSQALSVRIGAARYRLPL